MKKLSLALLLGLASAMANAAVVTYSFTGTFDNLTRTAPPPGRTIDDPLFLGLLQAGDTFSGTLTFDTAAPSSTGGIVEGPPFNTVGYPLLGFQLHASNAFDAALPLWEPSGFVVNDNQTWPDGVARDKIIADGHATAADLDHFLGFRLSAYASASSDFSANRVPYGYNGFVDGEFSLYMHHNHASADDWATGRLQLALIDPDPSLNVPEPGTGLLLLAGLAAFVPLRRRR